MDLCGSDHVELWINPIHLHCYLLLGFSLCVIFNYFFFLSVHSRSFSSLSYFHSFDHSFFLLVLSFLLLSLIFKALILLSLFRPFSSIDLYIHQIKVTISKYPWHDIFLIVQILANVTNILKNYRNTIGGCIVDKDRILFYYISKDIHAYSYIITYQEELLEYDIYASIK